MTPLAGTFKEKKTGFSSLPGPKISSVHLKSSRVKRIFGVVDRVEDFSEDDDAHNLKQIEGKRKEWIEQRESGGVQCLIYL